MNISVLFKWHLMVGNFCTNNLVIFYIYNGSILLERILDYLFYYKVYEFFIYTILILLQYSLKAS